ncbi:amidohydrolase family protein [Microlunatus elymi]|uniref:Amidohydrolase family protein n=1 Tax=Microlunatus elymi TaxID=2596828 RepID=A0A516Q0Z7_9ACTN|nr:amidohydrolase family protein [Microlunatus elymi]QDP97109.1 amidohydrolase family protein [Microlunatus elymi]
MIIIDAHQHVWDRTRSRYAWLSADAMGPLRRDIGLAEGLRHLDAAGIDGTVLVQADDTLADTELMIETAADPRVLGVVGWVPLDRPDEAQQLIMDRSPLLVGIRNLIHDRADPNWLLTDPVDRGLAVLERAGLPLDVPAVLPRHLEVIIEVADRHPELIIVIDHLAKPPIGLTEREPWWTLIGEVGRRTNVLAKVSGLYAAGDDPAGWTADQLTPYVDRALEVFGTDRLIYGGDWPVAIIGGDYERTWPAVRGCLDRLSELEQAAILGGNAIRWYRLDPLRVDAAVAARSAAAGIRK